MEVDDIINDGVWNYMAVTYNADASWLKIYKNGKAVYQAANAANFGSVTNTAYLYIGNDQLTATAV